MLPDRSELQNLYPKPKTYEELESRRKASEVASRPKHIPLKVGVCTLVGTLILFAVYYLIAHVLVWSDSEESVVVFSVFFAVAAVLVSLAVIAYLSSVVKRFARRVLISDTALRFVLLFIVAASLYSMFTSVAESLNWVAIVAISITCLVTSALAMEFLMRVQSGSD